jgi:hypothetical protein
LSFSPFLIYGFLIEWFFGELWENVLKIFRNYKGLWYKFFWKNPGGQQISSCEIPKTRFKSKLLLHSIKKLFSENLYSQKNPWKIYKHFIPKNISFKFLIFNIILLFCYFFSKFSFFIFIVLLININDHSYNFYPNKYNMKDFF